MVQLALVMIARNEAHCIARCLESARPFVDEMIVLDTGSDDDTMEVARAAGATVYQTAWREDFALARNTALAHSTAEWNLFLDADEWLAPGVDNGALRSLVGQGPFVGQVQIASHFDLQGQVATSMSTVSRLLPRGAIYTGAIHEQVTSDLPRKVVPLRVEHAGYLPRALARKQERNRAMLERALEAHPSDAYLLYQMGKHFEIYEDFSSAVAYFAQALELTGMDVPYRHDLVVRTIYSLKKAGQHEDAIALADAEMDNWQYSPDYYFALGDLLLDWAALNPDAADELLPMVEASFQKCLELGEQPQLEGAVGGRGSFLAAHNLAIVYDGLGDVERSAYYRALSKGR